MATLYYYEIGTLNVLKQHTLNVLQFHTCCEKRLFGSN